MTAASFLHALSTEVSGHARSYSLPPQKAFLLWFAKLAFDLGDADAFENVIVDGPNDKTVDLFWVDEYHERVVIVQGMYSDAGVSKPKVPKLEGLLSCFDWLASPETLEREGKPELADAAREYADAMRQDYSTELWFAYCGTHNSEIDKRIRVYNSNPDNQQRKRSCSHCDIALLESLFEESRGKGRRIERAVISLSSEAVEVSGGFGKGLLATVRGRELVSHYSEHGDALFARNVRLFLGAKRGSVNAGIMDTLEDASERGLFWAYNNGLTIVCDQFDVDQLKHTLTLHNFSIVNGCQTTVALHKSERNVTDDVTLLLRVINPPEAAIDAIIRFTNSQNQIRLWDLRSQDRTQKRLQRDFENLLSPHYYQLRRGDVKALDQAHRKKFRSGRKMRIIRHDLLAQYLAAFRQKPVMAYKHKSLLFSKVYEEVFPADLGVEEALLAWTAATVAEEKIRDEINRESAKGNNQAVLILKRGGRLYALATLGCLAHLRNGPDYLRTIDETRILSRKALGRFEKYATIATLWYKDAAMEILKASGKDVSVVVRELDFFDQVASKIESRYRTMTVDKQWLVHGLPELF